MTGAMWFVLGAMLAFGVACVVNEVISDAEPGCMPELAEDDFYDWQNEE